VGNRFDAKHAFGFGINLQGQLAAVQLEDRQIIRRFLDRDFPFGRPPGASAIFRPVPIPEDGLDRLQIQWRPTAVDEGLKHLIHVGADGEDQVSTVFDLIVGVLVAKPAAFLLVVVQGEADTGVNPTLADLAQPPYSPRFGQGVCDLRQACGVRDIGKAVSLFGEEDAGPARPAGDVFVAVQHHLGRERGMAADLDGQMAPVGIEDVKRVVVDIRDRFLSFDVVVGADSPHWGWRPSNQNQEQPLRDFRRGQIVFGKLVLALPDRAIDNGNCRGPWRNRARGG